MFVNCFKELYIQYVFRNFICDDKINLNNNISAIKINFQHLTLSVCTEHSFVYTKTMMCMHICIIMPNIDVLTIFAQVRISCDRGRALQLCKLKTIVCTNSFNGIHLYLKSAGFVCFKLPYHSPTPIGEKLFKFSNWTPKFQKRQ